MVETQIASSEASSAAPRPRLALRIGVTGARNLDAKRLEDLREKVRDILESIKRNLDELAREAPVAGFYSVASDAAPMLRFLSPLARGTDRLAARIAVELGYGLYVPMPFAQAEYERDFVGIDEGKEPEVPQLSADEDLKEFRDLLGKAGGDWIALDGDREDPNRAYEGVGRFVARHCDILIAIWNGRPASGRGGTAEIIEYAAGSGVPIWWIHADKDKPPVWIGDLHDLRDPLQSDPAGELRSYLRRQILPPGPAPYHRHGPVEAVVRLGQKKDLAPEAQYYAEEPSPVPGFWRIYDKLMRLASEPGIYARQTLRQIYDRLMRRGSALPRTPPDAPLRPQDHIAAYWFKFYEPADARATEYAKRYRSSYVWIFIFATLALLFGVLANLSHEAVDVAIRAKISNGGTIAGVLPRLLRIERGAIFFFAFLELAVLVTIFVVAVKALRGDWHRRSIEYRLLAELCRKQQVLGPLGNAVSLGALHHIVLGAGSKEAESPAVSQGRRAWIDRFSAVGARLSQAVHRMRPGSKPGKVQVPLGAVDPTAWVAWLFAAYERAAPLPRGDVREWLPVVLREELLDGLIVQQLKYHEGRRALARSAGRTFEVWGAWTFLALIVVVLLKLAATLWNWGPFWDLFFVTLAILLPAVSAAFVGIRSYAELQLLAEQSSHMLDELQQRRARIERISLRRPLAFHDIGAEAHGVAVLMLQDLEGWARLFRGKAIEPGG